MKLTEKQVKDALKKDFRKLYVKEFTVTWKNERVIREIEIDIMPLENLMKLLKGR